MTTAAALEERASRRRHGRRPGPPAAGGKIFNDTRTPRARTRRRRPGAVEQRRHDPGGRALPPKTSSPTSGVRPRLPDRHRSRASPRHPRRRRRLEPVPAVHRALRAGPLRDRAPGRGRLPTIANDGVRVAPRLVEAVGDGPTALTPTPAAGQTRVVSERHRAPSLGGCWRGSSAGRHRGRGVDPGLPGRRQDRHRAATTTSAALLRLHGELHREGAGGRPEGRRGRLPAEAEPATSAARRGAGVQAGHDLRARSPRRAPVRAPRPLKVPPGNAADPTLSRRPKRTGPWSVRVASPDPPSAAPRSRDRSPRRARRPRAERRVTGVTLDSRAVLARRPVRRAPGRARTAPIRRRRRESGAVAVLTDPEGVERIAAAGSTCRSSWSTDPRRCSARSRPGLRHRAPRAAPVGVTGTNGKTTTAYLSTPRSGTRSAPPA